MRPIPPKLRAELADDPYMKKCLVKGIAPCSGRVEWHHVWIYAGRQINEKWAILPACHKHHEEVNKYRNIKDFFERQSFTRTTIEEMQEKYPKKNWYQIWYYLNNKV